ncbi:NupC/NupG family nucleoside CNT transporter [Corallibacter sp.]|uniref:NupC/NupG family nucleoside CNT transporter n=1 Tax=Corallibacter sp. TaxID=2038084 RepID=UPI003AB2145A
MKHFLLAITAIFFGLTSSVFAQDIEKKWHVEAVAQTVNDSLATIKKSDTLTLNDSAFKITNHSSTKATGDYMYQNSLLVAYYTTPKEHTVRYKIKDLTDSTLVLTTKNTTYTLSSVKNLDDVAATTLSKSEDTIIPSQGFSMQSLARGALGMLVLLLVSFILSKNRKAINWKTIGFGLAAQLLLAIGVLKIPFVQKSFEFVGKIFVKILEFTQAGSEFLLGGMMDVESFGFIFVFQVLPTIIFFSALTSLLFYLGVIQVVVKGMAWVLTKLLGISGAESLSVAGNIFLGQTEAPLMIKAYLEKMTKSEILLVMVGGMATVAGGVLAAYIGFLGGGDPELKVFYAKHLLTASVMAAPGAIVISKMLYPQQAKINSELEVSQESIGSNILDAIATGTTEGLKLAANVGAMLLVFVAFIAMINYGFGKLGGIVGLNTWIAQNTPYTAFSLEFILGYIFAPLMWLIGVAKEDMALMGQLLGIKLAASEFVGYIQLAELKNASSIMHLKFEKSIIMATYMLCGFANFASIGIQIGGIGSLAPGQRKTLSEFGLRALIGGTIASLLSATIAGMIIG